ncbi:hypothetical protein C0989_000965 [Termitomyces sp. Mn162]|nr:hypothetical protein C0989_000965 [Termitomyces sp. Mn162]
MDCRNIAQEVYDLARSDDPLATVVREALEVIDCGLDTHGQESVSISFNGGKDCTVLLHLYAGALARRLARGHTMKPIPAIYIPVPSPFPSLEKFIEETVKNYNLDLFRCSSHPEQAENMVTTSTFTDSLYTKQPKPNASKPKGPDGMRRALEAYKRRFPHITAILIGTRRSDPHGGTSRFHLVPPSSLIYTSLGSTFNTFPNPALLIESTVTSTTYPDGPVSASSVISPATALTSMMLTIHDIPSTPENEILSPGSVLSTCMSSTHTLPQSKTYPALHPASPTSPNAWKMSGLPEPRYRPAYELQDGNLERSGRGLAMSSIHMKT